MAEYIKIKKGLNIKLAGEASMQLLTLPLPEIFAIKPPDFQGVTPKLLVKEGDEILAGSPLFYDKGNESVVFSSPVSGEVTEVLRGDKRVVLEIKILADRETNYQKFEKADPANLSRETVIETLLKSGAWPFIRQRPFGTIANPGKKPKSIFISGFDSSPLAPDYDFIFSDDTKGFQAGLDALQKLTDGKVHLNIRKGCSTAAFVEARGVQVNYLSGPHPAGNIGTQVHYIDPLNKGESVWFINPQDVMIIGNLFTEGKFDATRIIAVTGSSATNPKYYKTIVGCSVKNKLEDTGIKEGEQRIISGNVLTGKQISAYGFLGFYDTQLTVIPEGRDYEFMGWLAPGFKKFSMSRAFFNWLRPNLQHNLNTNLHGEERPFVVTGEYEKVFPLDIYPVQLIKSILIGDVDMMEKLGIYEVVEEDFALCEVVCTSKIKSQAIIRRGLDIVQREFG